MNVASAIERLRPSRVCQGLTDHEIARIAAVSRWREVRGEEIVTYPGDSIFALYTITRGRLRLYRREGEKQEKFIGYANLGETVGQTALLTEEVDEITIIGDMPSQVAVIPRTRALKLMLEIPRLRENLLRSFGLRIDSLVAGKPFKRYPKVIGVCSDTDSPIGRKLLPILLREVVRGNEQIAVISDRADEIPQSSHIVSLDRPKKIEEVDACTRRQITAGFRVLIDIPISQKPSLVADLVRQCGETLWFCDNERRTGEDTLATLTDAHHDLHSRIVCVQVLGPGEKVGRREPCCPALSRRDMMLPVCALDDPPSRLGQQGLDRLVRHLRGVKIGLALGGGGARGLAHLGVLSVLDQAGISVDVMSGTSAGAMIGLGYAVGMTPESMIDIYTRELRPSGLLDRLPGGRRLHIFVKFRGGGWDELLRKYYHDWELQQLPIPFSVVATDLISGDQIVSESGDITPAILESINVPVMADPILKDGKMLVDGGVLNNLPVELLSDSGAEYVIGVDVSKQIPKHFAGNHSEMTTEQMTRPGRFETAYRVMDVSRRGLTQLQMSFADLMIEPNTSDFDFADFASAKEIADTGELAANEVLPELKRAYDGMMGRES